MQETLCKFISLSYFHNWTYPSHSSLAERVCCAFSHHAMPGLMLDEATTKAINQTKYPPYCMIIRPCFYVYLTDAGT